MNALPPVRHGGRLLEACRRFGGRPGDWLDLSTGINPSPWPSAAVAATDWSRLPEPDALSELEARAAAHFGVDPDHCCAIGGSELAIRLVGRLLGMPGRSLQPAYGSHEEAFAGPCAHFGEVPKKPAALIFANPNNPDGKLRRGNDVLDWSDRLTMAGSWLVVDEAYADCDPVESVASGVQDGRQLIVLRSFGKFFGLAGLRLGFVLGPGDMIAAFREAIGDWPVHSAALAIGSAAYGDSAWIAGTRLALFERARAIDSVLAGHGLTPLGACPLFRLVETRSAQTLFRHLAQNRILVRPFERSPDWLRIGAPASTRDLARLDRALSHG
ncbi:threonine-phosphate decarboxylase [Novosphingobium pentaromativorans]|uniref:Aminotransferase n=1 Tax=Novosphingobium pentaromativorans US6-1 TaxID=1088721 RepID=G6EIV6_9SPHN|nr:threonine-phosphate decarboxylase [Novosphingobium pentaromativorans]AIT78917.1 aminotransferase [Novosphingobium pentaromativorans US6-1]EHJ58715.1 cobalamin biosynthetic protein CobC [Novosphingobium pentaromativorans US6-1]